MISNSRIFAGAPKFASSATDFTDPTASIGTIAVTSRTGSFSGTRISAPSISTLKLRAVTVNNGGAFFGVSTRTLRTLTASTPANPKLNRRKLTTPSLSYSEADFIVQILA
jgi:hypothetical protein